MPQAVFVKDHRVHEELTLEILTRAFLEALAIGGAGSSPAERIRPATVGRQVPTRMGSADFQPGKTVQRSLENQVGEEDRGFQRIPDGIAQATFSLQSSVLRGARRGLRMHENHDPELFRLCPEWIELAIRQFLALAAASDRGPTKAQPPDRFIQLIGRQIGVLQRNRRHAHKSVRMRRAPLRDFFVLQLDDVARQAALCRVSPGVDVDDLIVDALGIHILESLRVTEGYGAGEVVSRCRGQRSVLHEVPDLRDETVGVNVDGLHTAAADEHLTALARGGADLAGRHTGVRDTTSAAEQRRGNTGDALEEVSALWHVFSFVTWCRRLAALLENKLGAEFEQAPAHDLYRVHELVIRVAVARLLVEDGAPVEDVIEVEIPLQLGLSYREGPAETEIQLHDPIVEDRVGRNQRDRAVGGTRSGRLIALRQVPAER